MRFLIKLFPKSLTGKVLVSFAVFALTLTLLGGAFFQYQASLFNPQQFNQQLTERSLLAINLLDRQPNARENRLNQAVGTASLIVLPVSIDLDKEDDIELLDDYSPKQRRFLTQLKRSIRLRDEKLLIRLKNGNSFNTRSGLRNQQRALRKFRKNPRKLNAAFVEVSDDLVEKIEKFQLKNAKQVLTQRPGMEFDDERPFFRRAGFERRNHWLARALKRPVVLLSFQTTNGTTRQMLIMPAFINARFVGLLICLFFGVLALAAFLTIYAVGTVTKPLAKLSQSARQFGLDLQPAAIETSGNGEVNEAVKAFNTMQGQVRGLVDERTRIIGAVSHDLRTHLTRMRLRMQMLADQHEDDSTSFSHAQKTIADLEDMEKILVSSLEYSRHSTGENTDNPEKLDLSNLLKTVVDAYVSPIPFNDENATKPVLITADETGLKRALNNLISNAENHASNPVVELKTTQTHAIITICDEGPGIPEDERNKVLEPFYRLEQSRNRATGGSGLGLAIANEIISKNKGKMHLGDRKDGIQGLCVTIEIQLTY
ncbi:MAG: ATP-binding protein [Alphaproteobacteria bacterium]